MKNRMAMLTWALMASSVVMGCAAIRAHTGEIPCQANADCASTSSKHICVKSTCEECATNADCGQGMTCDSNYCHSPSDLGSP